MELKDAMATRHAVRSFIDKPIDEKVVSTLSSLIDEYNKESGLHLQLFTNEPKAFNGIMAHLGKIKNCKNYIAVIAKKSDAELAGYYGEKLVLTAQTLGLNSCWIGSTYTKRKVPCKKESGEKLLIAIALGYGDNRGEQHKSKPIENLCEVSGEMPDWFKAGMKGAMLAPTAVNQQKFFFKLDGNKVTASTQSGAYTKLDLGIAKLHFELGAGTENFTWA